MATNHFGHFLLTNLLIDVLKKTPNSRIVNLSSMAHERAKFDFDNFNAETKYD
jgi:NAD(P)-dependent dehydrogenase (short-subunit alcohol dehydrogenase family)